MGQTFTVMLGSCPHVVRTPANLCTSHTDAQEHTVIMIDINTHTLMFRFGI